MLEFMTLNLKLKKRVPFEFEGEEKKIKFPSVNQFSIFLGSIISIFYC